MKMNRLNVSLPARTLSWLQAEADRLGVSKSEIMRRLFDEHMKATKDEKTA